MSALTIVTKVQPKPTKTEILDALVQRAEVKFLKAKEIYKAKRAELRKQIEEAALEALKTSNYADPNVRIAGGSYFDIDIIFEMDTAELRKVFKKLNDLPEPFFDRKKTRDFIRQQMNPVKPGRLLEDAESVKALDALLDSFPTEEAA